MRFSMIHLFALAVFSTVIACGPADTEPPLGSDSSQQEVRDAGTTSEVDSGTSSAPDAGTTSEVDSGRSTADACVQFEDMNGKDYTCDNAFRTVAHITLISGEENCRSEDSSPDGLSGIVVMVVPETRPDNSVFVNPTLVPTANGPAHIPSFEYVIRGQGNDFTVRCTR